MKLYLEKGEKLQEIQQIQVPNFEQSQPQMQQIPNFGQPQAPQGIVSNNSVNQDVKIEIKTDEIGRAHV